jgi:hypothetical protein
MIVTKGQDRQVAGLAGHCIRDAFSNNIKAHQCA